MFAALFLACAFAGSLALEDISNPRISQRWVSAEAGIIDDLPEAILNNLLETLHRDLTVEVAVVTVNDGDGGSSGCGAAVSSG